MIKARNTFLIYLLLTIGFTSQSGATDLMDVYHQSLDNDPGFKAAYSTFFIAK